MKRGFSPCGLLRILFLGAVWLFLFASGAKGADSQEKILEAFYPYRQGAPQAEGITPGMRIGKTNWQVAEKVLPPEILQLIQVGDLEITVQETTDIPVSEPYIAATLSRKGEVQIGEDGHPTNYDAGLPFPTLDPQDPQAGLKAAWNNRFRDLGYTRQIWPVLTSRNSSGRDERTLELYYAQLYGMHRAKPELNIAAWEKEGILYKEYFESFAPLDIAGGQSFIQRYSQDIFEDKEWAYDPKTRRVRKLVYNPQEAAMGLDFLREDGSGFWGHPRSYTWRYLEERVVLVPGIVKGCQMKLGGKGRWYPMQPWELRRAVVVEAIPKDSGHPYGRRVIYFDKQTYAVILSLIYDHEGKHLRTFFLSYGHPAYCPWNNNPEVRVLILIHESWIDHQADHAAIYVAKKALYNQSLSPKLFSVKEMLRRGK